MAMFASGQVDGVVTVHHVEGSKRSIPVAGKAIDQALIAHMVNKADGGDRLRAELLREGGGQPIKEDIFETGQVTRRGISTSLQDFLDSAEMCRVESAIKDGFDSVLFEIDRSFFRSPMVVAVRFSGGGAFLPFLKELVRPQRLLPRAHEETGTLVNMGTAKREPQWADVGHYAGLYEEVGGKFHRMAVALGGAYYGAEGRSWLQLEEDVSWLGSKEGPTRSTHDGESRYDDARTK